MPSLATVFKRNAMIVALCCSLVLFIVASMLLYFNWLLAPVSKGENTPLLVEVPADSSSKDVATLLEEKGLVKSALAFRIYSRYKGLDSKIQTGEHYLNSGMSTREVLQTIITDGQVFHTFTIPEGYTIEQIADLLHENGYADRNEFLRICAGANFDYPFLQEQVGTKYVLEGYLFPDTYKVSGKPNEMDIIRMMLDRFLTEYKEMGIAQKAQELGLTVHQVVTIAAMIEREAMFDNERPLISGVIQNRLQKDMLLQIDATVLYALGKHKEVVLYKDLEVDSPYNTYRAKGLPPGPIANPGAASLKAAVEPEQTDYLYYLAKPDGRHVFSKTLSEHNEYKAKYL